MLDGEWNSLAVDVDGGIASECGLHPFLDHVNGMVAVHVGLVIEPMITGTLVTCHVFNETVVGFFAEGGVNNKEYNILKFLVLIHGSVGTVFCKLTKVCKLSCIARVKKCEEKVARTGVFLCRLYLILQNRIIGSELNCTEKIPPGALCTTPSSLSQSSTVSISSSYREPMNR